MGADDVLDTGVLTESDLEEVEKQLAEKERPAQLNESFDNIIVVDNIPVVGKEKFGKLKGVLTKIFSQVGSITADGLHVPQDSKTGATLGFAFIEFETAQEAQLAVEKTNWFELDKKHVFRVNRYTDFDLLAKVNDEYVRPTPVYEDKPNLKSWLLNTTADQFVVRYADDTEILWHERNKNPVSVYKERHMTESYVEWSPKGTYLATCHQQGIIIWGGEQEWKQIRRFKHPGVGLISFSPCENYLVTLSPQFQDNDNPKDPRCIIIWDIKTGEKKRGFDAGITRKWPAFQWSHDDKYFARLSEHGISIYETPNMGLLGKKTLVVKGCSDFCWSPADHILSCWTPETGNTPARVMLYEIPSRREKRQKTLFNVSDVKMHWQDQGNFLCVKVDRHTKSKKFTNFEIFRIREKGIPIEVLELQRSIVAFAWEPKGRRFAMIHSGTRTRPDIAFYDMGTKNLKELATLENKPASHLFWSPRGRYIVLAGLKNLNGALEFYDAERCETLGNNEHVMASEIEWDPTGRYVVSCSSAWRHQFENGYNVWTFQGTLKSKVLKDRFYQFLWRPRPPSLLSAAKKKEIKKNLGKYKGKYASEDASLKDAAHRAKQQERQKMYDEFMLFVLKQRKLYLQEKATRTQLRGGIDSDDEECEERIEITEEVIETKEEPLN